MKPTSAEGWITILMQLTPDSNWGTPAGQSEASPNLPAQHPSPLSGKGKKILNKISISLHSLQVCKSAAQVKRTESSSGSFL